MLVKVEPLDEERMRNDLSMYRDLSSKPIKGRASKLSIVIPVEIHEIVSTGTKLSLWEYTLDRPTGRLGPAGVGEFGTSDEGSLATGQRLVDMYS